MRRWEWALGLAGSFAALLVLALVLDWGALVAAVSALSTKALVAAGFASLAVILLLSWRWVILVGSVSGSKPSRAFHVALVAQAFNAITPGALGGDVYRVVLATPEVGRVRTTALVIVERLLGLSAYGIAYLLAYLGFVLGRQSGFPPTVFTVAALMFAGFAVIPLPIVALRGLPVWTDWLVSLAPRWLGPAASALVNLSLARTAAASLLSLAGVAGWLTAVLVLAYSAGLQLPLTTVAMIAITTEFSRLLPISIQGIGVREATFAWLATQAGGQGEPAVVACVAAYAVHFGLCAILAVMDRSIVGVKYKMRAV